MKQGYYIHFSAKWMPGIAKKIDMQVAEFSKFYHMTEIDVKAIEVPLWRRVCRLLPGGAIERSYEEALQQMDHPVFVYIRRATADKNYVTFMKKIREKWPDCKIIIEIFTYPYDKDDFSRWTAWPYYFKEIYNRKKLPKYIDRYVTYSQDEMIFGVPTVRTSNGILVDSVKLPQIRLENTSTLNLIAVAFMQKHHGYERIIKGMWKYYRGSHEREVILHLVGDGPEKKRYQKLTRKYQLEDKIIFYPTMVGEQLDEVYEKCDVAISALGVYKDGLRRENSLKTKEYMAKGFPMVTGSPVDRIPHDYPYVCEFSNDSTPIDVQRIVRFYDQLLQQHSKQEMQEELRSFVKQIADMPVVIKPVIDYIEEG